MGIEILTNIIIATIIYIVAVITKKIIMVLAYRFSISENEDVDKSRNSSNEKEQKRGERIQRQKPWLIIIGISMVMLLGIWINAYTIINEGLKLNNIINLGEFIGFIWGIMQSFTKNKEVFLKMEKDAAQANKYIRMAVEIIFKKREKKFKTKIKKIALKATADMYVFMSHIFVIYVMIKMYITLF